MEEKKVYTDEEKLKMFERSDEVGIHKAAKEFGVTWQMLTSWKKKYLAAKNPSPVKAKETSTGKVSESSTGKNFPKGVSSMSTSSRLEFENAVLRERVATLANQVEKLKKALAELI